MYNSPAELLAAAAEILRASQDYKSALKARRMNRAFVEKIMLAVTTVNRCRYCYYAHSRAALRAGVSGEELSGISRGDLGNFPPDERPALLFAQRYAMSGGSPDLEDYDDLVEYYGEETAAEILAYIRMIMAANLLGNTFDALLSRFKNRPAPESSLVSEFGTLMLAAFGAVPFGIVFALRLL